ncbi:MAG: hypothetical protein H0X02_12840, partial [Nitrosomonas sp.]|nr:hypothetical protein [Nitrosomonas sp.]
MLEPKCEDIALQAEALLSELERNILNWQFWYSMYERYDNPHYKERYEEAQSKGTQEKEGVVALFQGIFGGRAEAYAPGGKGIEDERDMVQKMLEVWGIFQRLKHVAREDLPWDEKELPAAPVTKSSSIIDRILANDGGTFTDDLKPATHDIGYYISLKGMGYTLPLEKFSEEKLETYVAFSATNFIGVWISDGVVYLDNTVWEKDLAKAMHLGKENEQQAIWDIENEKEIWVKEKASKLALHGLPATAMGAHPDIRDVADQYAKGVGLEYNPPQVYAPVDPERAKQIADLYDQAEHQPDDPAVKASYDAFKRETFEQYKHIISNGFTFEFYPEQDPYPKGPRQALEDLHQNKHLYVYPTSTGYGQGDQDLDDHPLLEDSGIKWNGAPVTYNDLFRGVHDFFGHGKEGVGFRAEGEENAWRQHAAMYSDLARPAMTAETRGQNSWVNYGPHGEANQTANQESTVYADQKATILPDWVHQQGAKDDDLKIPGALGKWSMAERTGDPELDTLIDRFMEEEYEYLCGGEQDPKNHMDYRKPEDAAGECYEVSVYFADWMNNFGMKSWVSGDIKDNNDWSLNTPEGFGYTDRAVPGYSNHHWVIVETSNGTYGIDFTAAQYGYGEFPMVQRLDNEQWQREWTSKTAAWADVMSDATELYGTGTIQLYRNGLENVVGQTPSQTRQGVVYETEIWPSRRAEIPNYPLALWSCDCEWGQHSWGRTRQFKKFEGRPCKHVLALYWT